MTRQIAAIHLSRSRGKLVLTAKGKTPRGQFYIARQVILSSKDTKDKGFKAELAKGIETLHVESLATE